MRMHIHQRERRLEQPRQKLLTDPAERETGEGDPELGGGKVRVEMRADMLRKNRAKVPLVHQGIKLTAAHFDDGKFRRHKKGVQHHQREDHRQLAQDERGGIPILRNRLGQRADREK